MSQKTQAASFGGNKRKNSGGGSYFVDRAFLPRIKEYLEVREGPHEADDVVDYLQNRFHEYNRKKRTVLRLSVERALVTLLTKPKPDGDTPKLDSLEENYLRKRQKRSNSQEQENDDVDSDDSLGSMDEELVLFKDTNAMNNSMQNMYKNVSKTPKGNNEVQVTKVVNSAESQKRQPPSTSEQNTTNKVQQQQDQNANPVAITPYENVNKSHSKRNLNVISEDDRMSSRPSTPITKSASRKKAEGTKERSRKFDQSVSTTTFKDIGGYENAIAEISKLILHLKHPEVFKHLGVKPPCGFLLHGAPGCGKTLLANAIAGELKVPFFKIAAPEVVSGISGESEQKIRGLFNEARMLAPCLIFIDEIDCITPKRETAGKEMERRVVTQILTCMDELASTDAHVLVIGATNRVDALDPALRRAGRFDREISLGIPDSKARRSILKVLCRDLRLEESFNFDKVASQTPGFVGADIQALVREAAILAVDSAFNMIKEKEKVAVKLFTDEQNAPSPSADQPIKTQAESSDSQQQTSSIAWLRDQPPLTNEQLKGLFITSEHFEKALPFVQPSAKREGFATVPDVTWNDIGALEDIRDELKMAIMAPVENPEEFEALGLTVPPGILLAGPPGCGKTLLAKAIANEAGINFISVKGPELLNMYVGESEKAVRQVFLRARNSSPCVIFFDEIDALCPRRSQTGDSSVSSRVVNQLLTEMDGLETRKHVYIMGATNRPDILDNAILRPGRLDKLLYVGLPEPDDRYKILQTITKNGTKPLMDKTLSIQDLANDPRCNGFSGADLSALVREASTAALKEFMLNRDRQSSEQAVNGVNPPLMGVTIKTTCIQAKHVEIAFQKVKPSVSEKDRKFYEDLQKRTQRL
ncbi:nuclear valosin-containing protein-like isoform X1 [Clytia hemisphaerica]|uniref:AAA+ ATPase domain-containing protein n=1 Tax=Clytia hemisphaerica TaxID=252671 RepID=A0A7M6DJK2_9CNID